jgi:ABC-2 type transport system permease protein
MDMHIKNMKRTSLLRLILVILLVMVVNVFSSVKYFRMDLTSDKRYTISDISRKTIRELDDIIFIKIYLEGDLPAGFRKLRNAIRDMLLEMNAIGGSKFHYEFIDIMKAKTTQDQEDIYKQLASMGLEPINLEIRENNESKQKIIIPGALVYYRDKSLALNLLKQQIGVHPEQVIQNSINNLEYAFISGIKKLQSTKKKRIAFIEGHGELNEKETYDLQKTLNEFYETERIDLPAYKVGILDNKDLIIIAKPKETFSEADKYKIDQFIMKGGKVIWLLESLMAEMDSLYDSEITYTLEYKLHLHDQLFKYGVRFNTYNLVQDLQCHLIPVMTRSGPALRDFRPWIYFPLASSASSHPIVNALNDVLFRFTGNLDTVHAPGVKKTVLLTSSEYSRLQYHPHRIDLQLVRDIPDKKLFNKGKQILAILLEGKFNSVFQNRIKPETIQSRDYGNFSAHSEETGMIIIADGDVIKNQISKVKEQVYPLGYDRFTNQYFGNKDFILNCIEYLTEGKGIISLRSKEFKLRMLNRAKVENESTKWQWINIASPIVLILLYALIYNYYRKQRYSIKTKNA